ncbi:MAG: EAL domain-containing protein [Candidatus Thiodiazotropha sp.]
MNSLDTRYNRNKLVLIGGSAGSFSALQEFFETFHDKCGLICIVIQHLSSEYPSHLDTLLSRRTNWPVAWAVEGTRLQEGHVYICEPGKLLSIEDNVLRSHQPDSISLTHKPIDFLAKPLAERYGGDIALVILSGTGSDGSEGARAVKSAGGVVIVQSPDSAEYQDMPASVLQAELADRELKPSEISSELYAWGKQGRLTGVATKDAATSDEELYKTIIGLVRLHAKQDMSGYKQTTLRRRIARRMGILHIRDLAAYQELLRGTPAELDQLAKDLLIGVTAFFRDEEAFSILADSVIPVLCKEKSANEPVRVWVAGCSTGEEAYSIAILLMEWFAAHEESPRIQIFATDIDDNSLELARAGVYQKESLSNVTALRIERFFNEENTGYRIAKSIRETIVFAPHNLISDPPFSKLDLVVCRNVLIYLNSMTQKKLLSLFHFVLNQNGFLFLGSSENVGSVGRHFHALSKQWRIFRHLVTGPKRPPLLPITSGMGPRRMTTSGEAGVDLGVVAGQERLYRQLLQSHGPTMVLINARFELLFVSGDVSSYLSIPIGQASHDLLKLVKPSLAIGLRSALNETQRSQAKTAVNTVMTDANQQIRVRIDVTPISNADHQVLLLVCFSTEATGQLEVPATEPGGDDWVLQQLLQELNATREDLHRTIEQSGVSLEEMKAANEEVMAMNEELQSANEELESSKEELQSLNEELVDSNTQLDAKVLEVETLNSDLDNLLNSTKTPTLLVDEKLCIRRFTPACSRIMRVIPSDIGRPIDDVVRLIEYPQLSSDCQEVLQGRGVPEREVSDSNAHWYLCRIHPFLETEGRVDGVVITFAEITHIKQASHLLSERTEQLQWQANLLNRAAPILGRDMRDRIVYWNKGAEELYGWKATEALGKISHDLLRTRFSVELEDIKECLSEHGGWRGELTHLLRDDTEVIVDSQWTFYSNDKGEPLAIVEVNSDITERKHTQEALHESKIMFQTMVDWTYSWEYWADPSGKFLYMTPSVERMTGYRREEFDDNPALLDAIVFPEDAAIWKRHLATHQNSYKDEVCEVVIRIVRKNGELGWINHACRAVFDESDRFLGRRVTVRDITDQKRDEETIHTLAYFDPLTQLPNRRLFMDRLTHAIQVSRRSGQYGALMMMDLDHFKSLNDTQGHDVGDSLLEEVAKRLLATIRAHDTVSRIGGDEFVILLEDLSDSIEVAAGRAETIAEKIRLELSKPYLLGNNKLEYFSSVSMGVSVFHQQNHSPELLLKQADVALYQAKDAGRNTARYFNPAMQAAIDARTAMETALRQALKHDEFRLYYQPQVDREGRLIGAEALIRWHDADASLIQPGQFIPLAEETGLIVPIGDWVLRTACQQLKRWEHDLRFDEFYLSVNVSARQLHQPDFVDQIVKIINETGVNPARLKLELTESAVLENIQQAIIRMRELIALGVSFSLDDFGTGYSSLSHLKLLPLSQVKIDSSFIRDLTGDPSDAAIVRAILAMNETLALPVIAEGVETQVQYDFLHINGCFAYQGYLFGPPVPVDTFECEWPGKAGA